MGRKNRLLAFSVLVVYIIILQNAAYVAAVAPPPPPVPGKTYLVYGYVFDANTGSPVVGASVKLYADTQYIMRELSDGNGYFRFYYRSSGSVGTFTVKINDPRYNPAERSKSASPATNMGSIFLLNPIEKYAILVFGSGFSGADEDCANWLDVLATIGFTSDKIFEFSGDNLDKSEIRAKVQEIGASADWNDRIVFAYSGHGDYIENTNIGWMCNDQSDYYYDYELKDDFGNTQADVFIFICACHSGAFIDDFQGLSNFFVATATDVEGVTYGMEYVSVDEPVNKRVKLSGTVNEDSMWTYWFLDQLSQQPSAPLEEVFNDAVESYRQWYISTKWVWQTVSVTSDGEQTIHVFEWVEDNTWTWADGEEPLDWVWFWYYNNGEYIMQDPALNAPIGAPQYTGPSEFYL